MHAAATPTPTARHAKRSLGQNFLQDQNVQRKIVKTLAIAPGDRVLEIGPGHGALTRWLEESPAGALYALEKDAALAPLVRTRYPRVHVALADAMDTAWEGLAPEYTWKLIGNLPYNVASPLVWEIASRAEAASRCVFMVQKEVGERLASAPDRKSYGALSVFVQSYMDVCIAFLVSPKVFRPQPKVESAVVVLSRRNRPEVEPSRLSAALAVCFQQRRKQLGTILKPWRGATLDGWFDMRGLKPTVRPENCSVEDFQTLADRVDMRIRP